MTSLTIEQCLRLALERRAAVIASLLQVRDAHSSPILPLILLPFNVMTLMQAELGDSDLLVQIGRLHSLCTNLGKQVPVVCSSPCCPLFIHEH